MDDYDTEFNNWLVKTAGEVKEKNVMVTGGASKLGALVAEEFLKGGAYKVMLLDTDVIKGMKIVESLNRDYKREHSFQEAVFIKCDISRENDINEAIIKASVGVQCKPDEYGKFIHIIVNCAGLVENVDDLHLPELCRRIVQINQGVINMTSKGASYMLPLEGKSNYLKSERVGATILNVASKAGMKRNKDFPIYCASQLGILHYQQCLVRAIPGGLDGIKIMTILVELQPPTATNTQPEEIVHMDPLMDPIIGGEQVKPDQVKETGEEQVKPDQVKKPTGEEQVKPETVAEVVVRAFKEGEHGAVWLLPFNSPGKDITKSIAKMYAELDKAF